MSVIYEYLLRLRDEMAALFLEIASKRPLLLKSISVTTLEENLCTIDSSFYNSHSDKHYILSFNFQQINHVLIITENSK